MTSRLQAFLKEEPLLRPAHVALKPERAPYLSVVSVTRDKLTRKEEEVCNRATD